MPDGPAYQCPRGDAHGPHEFVTGPEYGPALAGQQRTCVGYTQEDWDTNNRHDVCGDLDCPCQVKRGHHR